MSPRVDYSRGNIWLFNLLTRLIPPSRALEGLRVENVLISRKDGRKKLRLRVYEPGSVEAPTPVLLWMHGGGYVMGRPEQDDGSCAQYVHELGIKVVFGGLSLCSKTSVPCRAG